jgi:molybdate transport system substrate-binding protein
MSAILQLNRATLIAAAALPFALIVLAVDCAKASELKVFSSVALTPVLNEIAPAFESATGNKLNIEYGLAAQLKKRLLECRAY